MIRRVAVASAPATRTTYTPGASTPVVSPADAPRLRESLGLLERGS